MEIREGSEGGDTWAEPLNMNGPARWKRQGVIPGEKAATPDTAAKAAFCANTLDHIIPLRYTPCWLLTANKTGAKLSGWPLGTTWFFHLCSSVSFSWPLCSEHSKQAVTTTPSLTQVPRPGVPSSLSSILWHLHIQSSRPIKCYLLSKSSPIFPGGNNSSCLYTMGFSGGSEGKESAYNVGDLGSIPGLGRSPREQNGYPLVFLSG